jgi:hypothetical protein
LFPREKVLKRQKKGSCEEAKGVSWISPSEEVTLEMSLDQ